MYLFAHTSCSRIKKLILTTLCIIQLCLSASVYSQATGNISLDIPNTNLHELFMRLEKISNYTFSYDRQAAQKIALNNIHYKNKSMNEILVSLQKQASLDYDIDGTNISIRIKPKVPVKQPQGIPSAKTGLLSGKILDEENGEAVANATITIDGTSVVSSIDGVFSFKLNEGAYIASVASIGYTTKNITDITIRQGITLPLQLTLKREKGQLQSVTVTSSARRETLAALLLKQKNNGAITDGISTEQISRTPDNNIALALRRISGLQISDDNKYAIVRGLGERYNAVLLNGVQLPSSEPNRKNFAFDMIPSALVDNVVVNKTATPDLPGEFSGGVVQVNTKDVPVNNFLQLAAGLGYNTQSTGKEFISTERGGKDYIGFDDGSRNKPSGMDFKVYNRIAVDYANATATQRQKASAFLGDLPDKWRMQQYTAAPIQSYQLNAGRLIPIGKSKLGIIGTLSYRNEQLTEPYDINNVNTNDYKGTQYSFATTWGANLNIGYSFGKHKLTLQNTYNRRFSDKLYHFSGRDYMNNSNIESYSDVTLINSLIQTRLAGEHAIGNKGIKFLWDGSFAEVDRDQPFSHVMNMRADSGSAKGYYFYNFSDNQPDLGSIYYSELTEKRYSWSAQLQIPFTLLNQRQSLKFGYNGMSRDADFGADFYRVRQPAGSNFNKYNGFAYYDVYNSAQFANGSLYLYPIIGGGQAAGNGSSDGYSGTQKLNAFFGMADVRILKQLRVVGGLRIEKNLQEVNTFIGRPNSSTAPDQPAFVNVDSIYQIKKTDWLPSVNLIYSLTSKFNIRAAYYKTVARPDLRELSSFQYFDFDLFRVISGDNLQPTSIQNYDLRFEFYPAADELISVSGFYKNFKDPIEPLLVSTSGKPVVRYRNLDKATDLGLEVDVRKSFAFINRASSFLKNIYLSGSLTLIDANVDFKGRDVIDPVTHDTLSTKRNRPLYGQSPYIINGGLAYISTHIGLNVAYNRFGKRIVYASPNISEDEYEHPRDMLDMQLSYKFLKNEAAELRLNISNLLNQDLITYKNHYGTGAAYSPGTPSIPNYAGQGSTLPGKQVDPKGTSYNAPYDNVTSRRRNGTTYTLHFIYKL